MEKQKWVLLSVLTFLLAESSFTGAQQVAGTRNLPSFYNPGSTATVSININVDESNVPSGLIVAETPPSGWAIINSLPPYESATAGTYKWVFYGGEVTDRTITYTVNIPVTSTGDQVFSGKVEYLDSGATYISDNIQGDTITTSTPLPLLSVSPSTLNFGTDTTFIPFTVGNVGGADLIWQASVDKSWLTITRTSGRLSSGQVEVITANVTRSGLVSGTHTASINFTSNGGNSSIAVILVVGSPSPVTNVQILSSVGGNVLYWDNPSGYTGTIIFRKEGSQITGAAVNGVYYGVGDTAGDATCVFKDTTGLDHWFDDGEGSGLNPDITYYYNIYSFSDLNYSPAGSGFARPVTTLDQWIVPTTGGSHTVSGQIPVNGFEVNIPALPSEAKVSIGVVSSAQAPAHSTALAGFNNVYLLQSDIELTSGQSITLKIPVYQQDLDAAGVRKLADLKVYHWPGPDRQWEEMTILLRETVEADTLRGYISVKWENVTGNDYFSSGAPVPVPGGGGGCFIATAAFGSPLAGQIEILRRFRDQTLLRCKPGQAFVSWYNRYGPRAARYLIKHPWLKLPVRLALYPLIFFAWLSLKQLFWPSVVIISCLFLLSVNNSGLSLKKEREKT